MSNSKKRSKTKGGGKGKKAKAKTGQPAAVTAAAPEAQAADGKMSGLSAAAKVLAEAGEPLNAKTLTERILTQGLWQTAGKTPAATICAAMLREIKTKGNGSRFRKAGKGKFTAAK